MGEKKDYEGEMKGTLAKKKKVKGGNIRSS